MELVSYALVVLVAALVGLTIVQIVDKRLQDIEIRMPTITLPKIVVRLGDGTTEQTGGAVGEVLCKSQLHSNAFVPKRYKSDMTFVPPHASTRPVAPTPEPNNLRETPGVIERKQEQETQYYKDPKTMTAVQLIKFKRRGRLDKMTLVDYTNWLLAHRDEPDRLTSFHRGNLRVLVRGGVLTQGDMPQVQPTPPTSRQQYTEMVPQSENIAQPESLGYRPANFEKDDLPYVERSLDHLRYINKDEPLKTWELTHYKE